MNFTSMVNISFAHSRFPRGVMHGLITLLFRDEDRLRLINWQPIILHNSRSLPKLQSAPSPIVNGGK